MLFNSEIFICVFFPLALLASKLVEKTNSDNWRLGLLFAVSLVFYSYWDWRFTPLLLASIAFNYLVSWAMDVREGRPRKALFLLLVSANLSLLVFYKYVDLLVSTTNQLSGQHYPLLNLALPLGISFFTFTQLAYLVDLYRRDTTRGPWLQYSVFVTYFPHAIAGPILHHKDFIPQLLRRFSIDRADLHAGLSIFAVGLAKKVLVADTFSIAADSFFLKVESGQTLYLFEAWIGILAYTFQLYFDFSGYSDMAVGLSRCYGIRIPYNFRSPYRASNISEFWQRWHMSLSYFLKHYLYIPLGGNRVPVARRYVNILITMGLGGLWHGANWTFLIWGLLHGAYLVIHKIWQKLAGDIPRLNRFFPRPLGFVLTFMAVVIAWVFFRSATADQAFEVIKAMAGANGALANPTHGQDIYDLILTIPSDAYRFIWKEQFAATLIVLSSLFVCFRFPSTQEFFDGRARCLKYFQYPSPLVSVVHGLLFGIALLKIFNGNPTVFLYFQF